MVKNFFKTAIRALWRNKGFSIINIFGLSLGVVRYSAHARLEQDGEAGAVQ